MPTLVTRIRKGLPSIFTQGPPEPPKLTEAARAIIDADEKAGRELSVQEIQDLLGLDNVTLAAVASGIGIARAQWARYKEALAQYQQKQAIREERKAAKAAKHQQAQAQPQPKDASVSQPDGNAIPGEARTLEELVTPRGRSFSDLTADELSLRRRAILANTPFDLPAHRKFMNWLKDTWRVIGPPAFVVFTVWEVFYFMNHFLKVSNVFDVILLWGISLIIEIPFMIATYDQSERRERAAERRARNEPDNLPGKVSSLVFWCLLAAVNIVGQVSFLAFVTHAGLSLTDPSVIGLWLFIIFRVTGVIIGDCYTAFHLLPTEASIDRVLRAQQAQMEGEQRLAASDAERLRKDAEAKQAVRRVELAVQREEREVEFMEEWQKMNMRQTLARQLKFMELENQQLRQLGTSMNGEPETGDL
jgi:hypothetical protein